MTCLRRRIWMGCGPREQRAAYWSPPHSLRRPDAGRDAARRAVLRGIGAGPRRRPLGHARPAGDLAHLNYAVGRVGDAQALLLDTVVRCERVLPHGDPLTQAIRPSLPNIGEG